MMKSISTNVKFMTLNVFTDELAPILKMGYKDAMPKIREFKEKYDLTDAEVHEAIEMSKMITNYWGS